MKSKVKTFLMLIAIVAVLNAYQSVSHSPIAEKTKPTRFQFHPNTFSETIDSRFLEVIKEKDVHSFGNSRFSYS